MKFSVVVMSSQLRNRLGAVAALTLLAILLIAHTSTTNHKAVTLESSVSTKLYNEDPESNAQLKLGENDATATRTDGAAKIPHWNYDFEEASDLGEVISKRLARLHQLCENHREDIKASYTDSNANWKNKFRTYKHIITSDGTNLCWVAKAGSTFWKSVFIYLATGRIEDGLAIPSLLPDSIVSLSAFQRKKAQKAKPTFIIVRNPWKRLVSLYQEKIEFYLKEDGTAPEKLTDAAPLRYIASVCNMEERIDEFVTFMQLLDCVIKSYEQGSVNMHWQPAYELCDVCNVKYDYIVRVENMMNESEYVLTQAGLNNATAILKTVRDGTIKDAEKHKPRPFSDYYSDIPTDIIDKLRTMYRYETEIFNYPDTPFTS